MNATAERLEFAPPPTPGLLRAVGLAIIAHGFLVAALTWGVQWKQSPSTLSAEAELWSAIPQQAAPPPPPPPPPPQPVAQRPPPPPAATQPKLPDPQIALEREKQRLQKEKQQAAEKLEQEKQRKAQEKQRELDKQRDAEKRKLAEQKKAQLDKKAEQELAKKTDADRLANIEKSLREAGRAESSGVAASSGSALQSKGPSASYAGRLKEALTPKITFTQTLAGNPTVEIEVISAPDGTILRTTVTKSSGVRAWDEAVLLGLKKMATMPRDNDGRIISPLTLAHSPK